MAYYSSRDPSKHHTCRNCTEGNSIEKKYLTQGSPGSKCTHCASLEKGGNCTPGTPTPAT